MFTFQGITVELSAQDDHFLSEIFHLVLELKSDDGFMGQVNLLSRESSIGVWDANESLILPEKNAYFTLSVFAELGGELQLLASKKLYGPELCDRLGEPTVISLDGHESYPPMILNTIVAAAVGNSFGPSNTHKTPSDDDFETFDMVEAISEIIEGAEAACSIPDSHPEKSDRLFYLAMGLLARFQRIWVIDDIDNAIMRLQAAINLTPDDHPKKLGQLRLLGDAFRSRFERFGNLDDLDNAIRQHQAAVDLTKDPNQKDPNQLNELGVSLGIRFERLGNLQDIDDAIARLQEAVNLTPDNDLQKPGRLSNLGNSLHIRFRRLGHLDDLDNSIAKLQAAVNLHQADDPDKANQLNNLGTALGTRFHRLGNVNDINNSVVQLQAAVNLTPDGHHYKFTRLCNLAQNLQSRFKCLGNMDDLDHSISQYQAAVNLTPDDHPSKPDVLSKLGRSLNTRFQHLMNPDDIHNAIAQHQVAVNVTPDDHPQKPGYLTVLGGSLCNRFEYLGNLDDLNNGISSCQAAVNLVPDNHREMSMYLFNLGQILFIRFKRLGQPQDADACVFRLSSAALSSVGSPSVRFDAARLWVDVAYSSKHSSILTACECAISIIPLVAWLGLSIPDRHQHLVEIGGFVRNAAAIAITLGQYNKALEWLEQGRSIVWTQILQLRTPVDQLRAVEPDLADRLLHISQLLDQGVQDEEKRSLEEEAQRYYRALATERDKIIEQIRLLPNFEDFLKPSQLHHLAEAAKAGPVVVVNVSNTNCDALALVYGVDEVIHIPLPDLTSARVIELQSELKAILKSNGVRLRAKRDEDIDVGGDERCKRILAELWDHLVKPVLDSLAFSSDPDTLPRIWWCVTGPLAFLPIHAAGVYDTEDSSEQVQNYVISSYTPTISTLLGLPEALVQKPFRHLSVIEPSSGGSYIPNTQKELEYIRHHLQNRDHVVLLKADATKKRSITEMRGCNWLHLACHGIQNASNPTKSGLSLYDGKLTLEEIIRLDLPHAEFAFLSACQTMTGDENLSEEAVHIAGGMSLAGYRSVVATMWSIEDALAPKVADEFYARLLEDGKRPDNRKAAEALHFAVKKLREEKDVRMISWLPFVHLGI